MACYKPLRAFKSLYYKTENGKAKIFFKRKECGGRPYEEMKLPCGNCIGCRIQRSREWALRCVHESELYEENCFITLTFSPENLNPSGSLVKADFQNFMKRLRKKYKGFESIITDDGNIRWPIRFFHCGEYGTLLDRPHHHACLFNFNFQDKELWSTRNGVRLYRSQALEDLWPYGFCTVGDVTYESAAYCARYITKKINGEKAKEHYKRVDKETGEVFEIQPEYITMSRRPGIGQHWLKMYRRDLYPKDYTTIDGKKFRAPKYYDRLYDNIDPGAMKNIKNERIKRANKNELENHGVRLKVKEKVAESKANNQKRNYENGTQSL